MDGIIPVIDKKFSRNKKSNCSNIKSMLTDQLQDEVAKLNFFDFESNSNLNNLALIKMLKHQQRIQENTIRTEQGKNDDRYENMNFEQKYEKKRKYLSEKLKELKNEQEKLKKQLELKNLEIRELMFDIEVLSTYEMDNNLTDRLKKSMNLLDVKTKEVNDQEKKMRIRMSVLKLSNKIEDQKNKLTLLKKEKEHLIKQLDDCSKVYENTKLELQEAKNTLLLHYHKLLSEGKDTRREGLIWIIKAIWDLGHSVILSYFPSFLDEQIICYLFKYAKKDIEYRKTAESIRELKLNLKINSNRGGALYNDPSQEKEKKKNLSMSPMKTRIIENLQNNLNPRKSKIGDKLNQDELRLQDKLISHELAGEDGNVLNKILANSQSKESFTLKSVSRLLERGRKNSVCTLDFFIKLKELESNLEIMKIDLDEMKRNELKRINQEFITNEYERRFGVKEETIISVIIGQENAFEEYIKFIREQKIYYKRLKYCRTFNLIELIQKRVFPSLPSKGINILNFDSGE